MKLEIVKNPESKDLEKILLKIFYDIIFKDLFAVLKSKTVNNSLEDLVKAISSGRITFARGEFKGNLNSKLSKEIKALGAKWDFSSRTYKINFKDLSPDIKIAISVSESRFKKQLEAIDKHLIHAQSKPILQHKIFQYFDTSIFKMDKDINKTIEKITVKPTYTEDQRKMISENYTKNMDKYITKFTEENTVRLRELVKEAYDKGERSQGIQKIIEKNFKGITKNKAEFLARQEINLISVEFKKAKYTSAGINKYIWRCVHNPKDKSPNQHTPHNVRYFHGLLDGKVIDWNEPPIVNIKGERKHAGEDFNCRCIAQPLVSRSE
jgi:hypothetical protein